MTQQQAIDYAEKKHELHMAMNAEKRESEMAVREADDKNIQTLMSDVRALEAGLNYSRTEYEYNADMLRIACAFPETVERIGADGLRRNEF